ncbi:MAG: type VI secretion system-associated protein TagF [Variovorax sp.]|nr:MAG: type VI secretion system-associated protein TagF [Variovorax sp.]
MGDFAHRRLSGEFRDAWDRWLQNGLRELRVRHADWTERYLEAPLWCFVLGNGVIGGRCWLGVLMPSVDGVGRYFPFTVAAELLAPQTELQGEALAVVRQWWALASQAALAGLEQDLDALRFDDLLQQSFASGAHAADSGGAALALPEMGQSLWFTDPAGEGGPGMTSRGLPQDDQFEALFGFAADASAAGTEAM